MAKLRVSRKYAAAPRRAARRVFVPVRDGARRVEALSSTRFRYNVDGKRAFVPHALACARSLFTFVRRTRRKQPCSVCTPVGLYLSP